MNILLLTPPLTQLNTPYPATTVLKGFLKAEGYTVRQCDLSIGLAGRIFTRGGLTQIFERAIEQPNLSSELLETVVQKQRYLETVEAVWRFLQGADHTLATRIVSREFLPEGPRFNTYNEQELEWAFGTTGITDKAKHLATLYLEDLTDFIREALDTHFDLIRYGEQLALSAPTFDVVSAQVEQSPHSLIDSLILSLLEQEIADFQPDVVGFSIPFPGCLYAALICGKQLRQQHPQVKIVLGGGYINTELRTLSDPRLFRYTDFVTYDDGEIPCLRILRFLEGKCRAEELVRTLRLVDGALVYSTDNTPQVRFNDTPAPDFSDLDPAQYISMIELTNPMHKLWSDGFWNKMTVAHGCYWAKCAFCDTSLDYIARYEAPTAKTVVNRMEAILRETGQSGFHFTDEALPPKLLKEIALEILERQLVVSFWGNIRFEKAYTPQLCALLAQAGCIAVSGGLEVASERILERINKGVTLSQAARSMLNFTASGIMVHAYLMYGFPTQSVQETVDSLEVVRQMFANGLIQSAFWHRYTMTVHSDSGVHPERYGAQCLATASNPFANNGVRFTDGQTLDLDMLGEGLRKATYNYMHGVGLEENIRKWFAGRIPAPTITRKFIEQACGI